MDIYQFEKRKIDHIQEALNPENQTSALSGLNQVELIHEALPEIDFQDVSLASIRLGQSSTNPFFVAGMTAGHFKAVEINRIIASTCAEKNWAMGVGSQRRELERKDAGVDRWIELRKSHPDLALYANLGITQLISAQPDAVRSLVDAIEASALVIHTNPLQESLQLEGTPQFKGGFQALERIVKNLDIPIILKETGCGFSIHTLKRLKNLGLGAVDVSGLGGTHWGRIEGKRASQETSGYQHSQAAQVFESWGHSTVDSVRAAVEVEPDFEVWASGGVRTGLDAAKLLALGAVQVGFAKPALEAALEGEKVLRQWMEQIEFELKVALFCTGSLNPAELHRKGCVWIQKTTC